MVVGARASLKECLGHLRDAADQDYITDEMLAEKEALARPALREMAGYLDYLQSDEAEQNARRIKQARIERRRQRRATNAIGGPTGGNGTKSTGPEPNGTEPNRER